MIERSDLVKGWCPGALRPMQSGDGLIVRVRPRLSALSRSQLMTLAEVAGGFGGGKPPPPHPAEIPKRRVHPAGFQARPPSLARGKLSHGDPRIQTIPHISVT